MNMCYSVTTTTTPAGTTIPDIVSITESNVGQYFLPGELIFEVTFYIFRKNCVKFACFIMNSKYCFMDKKIMLF